MLKFKTLSGALQNVQATESESKSIVRGHIKTVLVCALIGAQIDTIWTPVRQ